jgi:selenocysteine-specific elongation factor
MPAELPALLVAASGTRRVGERIYAEDVLLSLAELAMEAVDEFHTRFPLELGASLQSVRARLGVDAQVAEGVLNELVRAGRVELRGAVVMRAGWSPAISPEAAVARAKLLEILEAAGAEPPSVAELAERCGPDTAALLRLLERDGHVVQVESERYYAAPALGALVGTLRAKTVPERAYTPAELRDLLGLSRKYLIPLLEYCDRSGITDRRGGERFVASVRN